MRSQNKTVQNEHVILRRVSRIQVKKLFYHVCHRFVLFQHRESCWLMTASYPYEVNVIQSNIPRIVQQIPTSAERISNLKAFPPKGFLCRNPKEVPPFRLI